MERDEQKNQRTGSKPRTGPKPRRTEPKPEPPVLVLEVEIFQFLGWFSVPTFLKNLVLGSIGFGSSSTDFRPMLIPTKMELVSFEAIHELLRLKHFKCSITLLN
nr:hypothetical protein [Tanacetum cinerariifolium]